MTPSLYAADKKRIAELERALAAAQAEADAFRAEVAALREDKARLDWLDAEGFPKAGTYPVAALVVKAGHDRNSSEWVNIGTTARAAIDAARKGTT